VTIRTARLSTPTVIGAPSALPPSSAPFVPPADATGPSIAKQLAALGKRTLAAFKWPASLLGRSYGEGKWNTRQILGHLTDTELVFLNRLQFMLAQDAPALEWSDQDLWAARFRYEREKPADMRDRFRMLRDRFVSLTRACTAADLARGGRHPKVEGYTVRYLTTYAVRHNARHLEQLDAIKAGRTWTPPA
jgi:uncharacterized damage-inducible protein DinB